VPGGQDSALYVNAASGTSADSPARGLDKTLDPYPQVQVRDQADYKKLIHDQIAVLLYLVYALLGLAIVIAVLGVVNTLALSVVERTREIGLLRAIGLARRQLRRMIRLESVVIAVFGAVLGLALGLVWGVCVQQVLALQGMKALAIPVDDDRRGRRGIGRRGHRGGAAAGVARVAHERAGGHRARVIALECDGSHPTCTARHACTASSHVHGST
jgi:hypothetical protein